MTMPPEPGWFGKLPCQGDFLVRRLPPSFVEPWDAWLSTGLAEWKQRSPEGWLRHYLDAPSQVFLLMPGALVPASIAPCMFGGVLMPSVDQVGRYFPFTLSLTIAPVVKDGEALHALLQKLMAMNETAIQAMQQEWSTEQLDLALANLVVHPDPDGAIGALAHQARGLRSGQAGWFKEQGPGQWGFEVTDGLPVGDDFARLLGQRQNAADWLVHQPREDSWQRN